MTIEVSRTQSKRVQTSCVRFPTRECKIGLLLRTFFELCLSAIFAMMNITILYNLNEARGCTYALPLYNINFTQNYIHLKIQVLHWAAFVYACMINRHTRAHTHAQKI